MHVYDTLDVNEVCWNYLVDGSFSANQILLVLHGWNTFGSKSWQDFVSEFSQSQSTNKICIIAPDMPGFGETPAPEKVQDIYAYANMVEQFVRTLMVKYPELAYKNWSILGHSYGGGVAAIIASNTNLKVSKLVLVAPAIVRPPLSLKQKLITAISHFGKKILGQDEFSESRLKKLWHALVGSKDYAKTNPQMRQIMQIIIRQDLQNRLGLITQPVLLVWGKKDKYTPFSQAKLIKKQVQNLELKELPKVNHGVHLYAYKQLATWVKEFLNIN